MENREPETEGSAEMVGISVVIPAYNAGMTLAACLDALFHQTVSAEQYEVIVVDDGSSDNTSEVARRFPVRYFFQTNRGPATARNQGANEAEGDILLFTDSDCVPAPDWVEQMTKPFEDASVAAVKGAYRTRQRSFAARFAQIEFEDRYDRLRSAGTIDLIGTYSAGFRKEVFLRMGGFDRAFPSANNEDVDFSYRLSSAGYRMIFNPEAIVHHDHAATIGEYLRVKFWRAYWRMYVYRRYPRKAVQDSYTPAVLKLQTMSMSVAYFFLVLSPLFPITLRAVLVCFLVVFASAIPFSIYAFNKDRLVGFFSWGIVFLRAAVFAAGSLWGIAGSVLSPMADSRQ